MRPSKDSKITIGILLLISLIFSVLLYLDFRRKQSTGNNPVIGEITFKEKSVHRKIDSSVVWDEVETKEPVANKDTIRTLDYSDATLTLNDGTQIRLSDNSMIYIDLSEKNLNINFDYGSMSMTKSPNSELDSILNILSGDKKIELGNGGSAKFSKNEDENVKVQVEQGEAKLSLNGKEEILKENQTAELNGNRIDVRPIRFILQQPTDGKYYSTSEDQFNINFQWIPLDKGMSAEIQIAKDKSFSQIVKKISGLKNSEIILGLNSGIFYWRISAKNPKGGKLEFSETRKLSIFAEKAVNITTPQNGKVFPYTLKLPTISLRWTKNDFATSYKIEIARDAEFKNNIKSIDSFENYISTSIPSKGNYYLRVTTRPRIPDLSPIISDISMFSVEERQVPYPPELISPVNNSSFGLNFIQKSKILFNWRDNREFSNYELEISNSQDFSSPMIRQIVKSNFSSPNIKEETGEIYWRVRGILPEGRKSEYSKINSLRITEPAGLELIYPESLAELDMNYDKSITFRWQRPETSGNFLLEISESEDFSNQILADQGRIVSGFSKKVNFNREGIYYWRLKLISREGKEITKSTVNKFTLLGAPIPKPISPQEGANIDLANKETIDFSWSKDAIAKSYSIEISDISKGTKRVVGTYETPDPSYSFKELSKLKDGNFLWSVSIIYTTKDGNLTKSPPASTKIIVQTPKLESPIPKPIQPLNGTDLVMGEKEEILFQWDKNDKAVHYQIDVQEKSTQRERPVFQKQTIETSANFEIPLTVGEGIYYWDLYIFYKTWDGQIVRSNPIRNEFSLKFPYRNPPLPYLSNPRDGVEITPNDNWQIPLAWESNERAISYNIKVNDVETNKTVFQETTEALRTIFIVSDSAIKPGKYVWTVSINYKAQDERIVKSPSRSQEFTLIMPSFEVPLANFTLPDPNLVFNPTDQSELEFQWEKSNSATQYSLELYELIGETEVFIAKKDTKENSFLYKDMLRLTNGRYRYKLTISYKDRTLKTINTEPLYSEFTVQIPVEDIIEPPEILSKPRLYVE